MKMKKLAPIHPGEILREEFMKPHILSQNTLARALGVPPRRMNEIVLEKHGFTADTAFRLARYFGTTAELWTGDRSDSLFWKQGHRLGLRWAVFKNLDGLAPGLLLGRI